VRGILTKLTLKHFKVDDWVLFSDKVEVIPELSDFFVEESDVADKLSCC